MNQVLLLSFRIPVNTWLKVPNSSKLEISSSVFCFSFASATIFYLVFHSLSAQFFILFFIHYYYNFFILISFTLVFRFFPSPSSASRLLSHLFLGEKIFSILFPFFELLKQSFSNSSANVEDSPKETQSL